MNYAEFPPTNYEKESGIRGLKQIATQLKQYPYAQRKEIVNRYFIKFVRRMAKTKLLTDTEKYEILKSLMDIIAEEL